MGSLSGGLLVNRYGYSPIALEWDIWLDPSNPGDLPGANVDHGSAMHLVQQVRQVAHVGRLRGRPHAYEPFRPPLSVSHCCSKKLAQTGKAGRAGVLLQVAAARYPTPDA